jgi:8-oxo-dGTP pyrophosphatase MutT (NUDIX family)
MRDFETLQAAGGLTIDRDEQILFIFKDGRWDLPKGLIKRRFTPEETACKEVSEETGIARDSLTLVTELIPTVHVTRLDGRMVLKTTHWYLLRHFWPSVAFKPQTKEGIEHCAWIPLWDLERPLANCPARIRYLVHFWVKARRGIDRSSN